MTQDPRPKTIVTTVILSVALALALILLVPRANITQPIHRKIYDALVKVEYKLRKPPPSTDDILFVIIDNETFRSMKKRWPYPRSNFAAVIENLKNAGARAVALDFIFYGSSTDEEDGLLKNALDTEGPKVLLGAAIDEEGRINTSTALGMAENAVSGIVTKPQDPDTVVRGSLTYLITEKDKNKCILSWGMQLLKMTKGIDISTLADSGDAVSFSNSEGEKWDLPVRQDNKSYLINFRHRTKDFKKLSFYRVLKNDFDPALAKDKIVLIGFISSAFWDFHNTPLGPLPGITLNANAFLTLYDRDFLKKAPKAVNAAVAIIGVILGSIFITRFSIRRSIIFIAAEILIFFALGLFLLTRGLVLDYALLPIAAVICPLLSKKIIDMTAPKWLNKDRTTEAE